MLFNEKRQRRWKVEYECVDNVAQGLQGLRPPECYKRQLENIMETAVEITDSSDI